MARRRRQAPVSARALRRPPSRPAPGRAVSTRTAIVGGIAIVLLGIAAVISIAGATPVASYACDAQLTPPPGTSAGSAFTTENLGRTHVSPGTKIRYGSCPPTSGNHYNAAGAGPLRPGFYGPTDAAGPGGWVHNLEHGYIVLLYRCERGSCPSDSDLSALRQFAANGPPTQTAAACGFRSKVVVARFDEMGSPFAVLAWDRALLLDSYDASAARNFANEFIERTGLEPNAC